MKTVFVSKLSICKCGFPLFNEHVKLGDAYQVDPEQMDVNSHVECGGCGANIPSIFIWGMGKGASHAGWLPIEAFAETDESMEISA